MKYKTKEVLARAVVEGVVQEGRVPMVDEKEVPREWRIKGACFVTLYIAGELHGCIGTIEARQPLYRDIIENAVGASTRDLRFEPINREQLKELTVEVSVLTPLKEYRPKSTAALKNYLKLEKPGLVIEKRGQRAVFLPQVWEQLPQAEQFLAQLCLKARLPADAWREGMQFKTFRVLG